MENQNQDQDVRGDDPVFTRDQAAAYCQMTPNWMEEHTRDGTLAHFRVGKFIRYRRSDLDAYLESVRVEAAPPHEGPRVWDRRAGAKTPRKAAAGGK